MEGRFYWLKLKRDFFKRHDIRIIESMPNGKEYILFYLKLLCESVDHDGNLRFSDRIPYSDEMLATITDTNVDVVRSAIKIFAELGMMELMDDGTYFMAEVNRMMGSFADNDNANRQRAFREQKKQLSLPECYDSVTKSNESKSKRESKSKSESKNIGRFTPPTTSEVKAYCQIRNNGINPEAFVDYYESKGWMIGKNKMKDWKAAVRTWEQRATPEEKSGKKTFDTSELDALINKF